MPWLSHINADFAKFRNKSSKHWAICEARCTKCLPALNIFGITPFAFFFSIFFLVWGTSCRPLWVVGYVYKFFNLINLWHRKCVHNLSGGGKSGELSGKNIYIVLKQKEHYIIKFRKFEWRHIFFPVVFICFALSKPALIIYYDKQEN